MAWQIRGSWRLGAIAVAAVLGYAGLTVAACAAQTDTEETTSDPPPSSGGGGAAPVTSVGSGGAGGLDAAVCEEEPCKLTLPQCGCGDGERCQVLISERKCTMEGATEPGRICADDCTAGHHCSQVNGILNQFLCRPYCEEDEDCKLPGGRCVVNVGNGGVAQVCSTNCDTVTNVGCAEDGMKCEVGQVTGQSTWFTFCNKAGDMEQGEACSGTSQCAEGYGCFGLNGMGNQCLKWCLNPPMGSCPNGTVCNTFTNPISVGAVQYGACVPSI